MTSLSVVSYIERINRMYRLIRKESTGSRAELAGRMRVSERTVSNYLEVRPATYDGTDLQPFRKPDPPCNGIHKE